MYENSKLAEAKFFYSQMVANFNDRDAFNYSLSAFLSSARSILQYALEEAKTKGGGQRWYDSHMAGSPVLSFFKDKRDINIHYEPVKPAQHINVTATATVHISASVSVIHKDASGNILYQSPPEERKPELKKTDTPAVVTSRYVFTDWTGSEDVMALSQMYINELERVVKDGIHRGFITG